MSARRISDRVGDALSVRGDLVKELQELLDGAEAESRPLNPGEQAKFNVLKGKIERADEHVETLRVGENIIARGAMTRIGPTRDGPQLAKGIGMARLAQLLIASKGNDAQAEALASRHFPDQPQLASIFRARSQGIVERAATTAATTVDPAWAGALAYQNQLSGELIELVMPQTVLGQLEGLRRVPFNVRIPREGQPIAQAKWVGEGQSKPVGRGSYDYISIPFCKCALIVVYTEELARFSDPAAEGLMRDGLVRSIAQFLDTEFLSSNAAQTGISPAGILNGLPASQTFASSGQGWAHILWDVSSALGLLNQGLGARRPMLIMNPANAIAVGFMPNAFGVPAFPSVNAQRSLAGIPVITSPNVPVGTILLVDADMILWASDPAIRLDISREASVQLDTSPATPPTGMVSLWQQNLIGLLAEQYQWWGRARDYCVVQITGVNWTAPPAAEPAVPPEGASATAAHATPRHRG